MPITIELSLIDDPLDPIVPNFTNYQAGVAAPANALHANTSTTWQIQNVQIKSDIVSLISGLNESYIKLLEEGKKLTLNYNTFISQYQSIIDQTDMSINITRSLTRLKSVFVSLRRNYALAPRVSMLSLKTWNDFFSPATLETINGLNTYNPDAEFQCQLQIGSKLYPEYPMKDHQEAFYQLRNTLGHQPSSTNSFTIKGYEYKSNTFVIAIDTEKVIEAGSAGSTHVPEIS